MRVIDCAWRSGGDRASGSLFVARTIPLRPSCASPPERSVVTTSTRAASAATASAVMRRLPSHGVLIGFGADLGSLETESRT